jgi:hypothetical protein
MDEVARWVTSWRDWAEVVQPPELRRDLREVGHWMAKTYAS